MTPAQRIASTKTYQAIPPERTVGLRARMAGDGVSSNWQRIEVPLGLRNRDFWEPDLDDQRTRDILRDVVGRDAHTFGDSDWLAAAFEHADTLRACACPTLLPVRPCAYCEERLAKFRAKPKPSPGAKADTLRDDARPATRAEVEAMLSKRVAAEFVTLFGDADFKGKDWREGLVKDKTDAFDPTKLAGWGDEQWELLNGAQHSGSSCTGGVWLRVDYIAGDYDGTVDWHARRTLDRLVEIVERSDKFSGQIGGPQPSDPAKTDWRGWSWRLYHSPTPERAEVGVHENTRAACIHAAVTEALA